MPPEHRICRKGADASFFKCTDNPPVSDPAKFITMDGKPSDHYLWLTGPAALMLRGELPLSIEMPERK